MKRNIGGTSKVGITYVTSTEWGKTTKKRWEKNNRIHINSNKRRRNREKRYEMVYAYGGSCVNCNESNYDVLQLDHINNDGYKEKERSTTRLLSNFLKNGANKEKYQLLCCNCNWLKNLYYTELCVLEKEGIPPF